MATPRRIYRIYADLRASAPQLRDALAAKGEEIPGTVALLVTADAAKLLTRWGEEMDELCGVLDGSHLDPYIMESTQTFYWGSLFGAVKNASWEDLRFDDNRRLAATCGINTIAELKASAKRLAALGASAKPEKLFLLWNVADCIYRQQTKAENRWTLEQLMEADLQEMKKRPYLAPILERIVE
ncbi:MAG: hypothetical protein H0V44_10980 [Planctomycetes bacterium]|nr:hypothetical protein [Planctomycetota bacterium]